jgi:hypothetical protein
VTPVCEVFDLEREERTTGKGTLLFYTRLKLRVTWTAPDGSSVATVTAGEAMDSGDKATNKATSAAFKYACFLLFTIPLNEPDADEHTPEPVTATKPIEKPKPPAPPRKLPAVLGDLLHAMGAKNAQEADAILRFCLAQTFADAMKFSEFQAVDSAQLIEGTIGDRMETLKGTRAEAMASIYAEAAEAASKKPS